MPRDTKRHTRKTGRRLSNRKKECSCGEALPAMVMGRGYIRSQRHETTRLEGPAGRTTLGAGITNSR
eukprot:1156278-Pelagomonas_calceolata.AAC.4